MNRLLALTAALLALPACESIESGDLDTSGIWADIQVRHDGDGTLKVTADLKSGGRLSNTWLELTDGDRLDAMVDDGTARRLRGKELLSRFWYETTFDRAHDDALVSVAFSRDEKNDAPTSQVRLPLNFDLTAPAAGAEFGPGEAISVAWSNASADGFELSARGDCIEGWSESVGDTGSFRLPAEALTRRTMDPGCTVTLELRRIRGGAVDDAFKSGQVVAVQSRQVEVSVTLPPLEVAEE